MSLLDKLIHHLDEQYQQVPFYQNEVEDIKNNIQVLLNANLDDCIVANDLGLSNAIELNLNSKDFCLKMAKEIHFLINKYEQRIRVLSISYDNSLGPWQLSFILKCALYSDSFKEFSIEITFKNNRYCEIT